MTIKVLIFCFDGPWDILWSITISLAVSVQFSENKNIVQASLKCYGNTEKISWTSGSCRNFFSTTSIDTKIVVSLLSGGGEIHTHIESSIHTYFFNYFTKNKIIKLDTDRYEIE